LDELFTLLWLFEVELYSGSNELKLYLVRILEELLGVICDDLH